MKIPDMKKVEKIAFQVRKAMEKFAPAVNDEVGGNTDNLMCFCAIASHALMTALKKNGIESRLVDGFFDESKEWDYNDDDTKQFDANHCWVEVAYHYVDITATQFCQYEEDEVLIIDNNECDSLYYPYHVSKRLKNITGKNGWGKQAPQAKYTKKILALAQI